MVVAGDVEPIEIKELAEKWFGDIPSGDVPERNLPKEEIQTANRTLSVKRNVPANAIYKAFHMCSRSDQDYYATDLLSDILSNGDSSRLYSKLVKEQKLFSELHAFISGDIDEGMFIISGKLMNDVEIDKAEQAIHQELEKIKAELVSTDELQKVKNKIESSLTFSEVNILTKAMNLAYYELLGDAKKINEEVDQYELVNAEKIQEIAQELFRLENESTLYYLSE